MVSSASILFWLSWVIPSFSCCSDQARFFRSRWAISTFFLCAYSSSSFYLLTYSSYLTVFSTCSFLVLISCSMSIWHWKSCYNLRNWPSMRMFCCCSTSLLFFSWLMIFSLTRSLSSFCYWLRISSSFTFSWAMEASRFSVTRMEASCAFWSSFFCSSSTSSFSFSAFFKFYYDN